MITFKQHAAPTATVLVIGLREARTLLSCLRSVASTATNIAYEMIIVLNDPTPTLANQIEKEVTGATVFSFRANTGFGVAANFGAQRARGQYLLLLNDDCVVSPGWIDALVDTERRRISCGLVGGTLLHPDGSLQEAGSCLWSDGTTSCVGDGLQPGFMGFERRVDYCSGGCLLVRKDVWDKLGGFDENYYPAYYEDVDFCLRAAEAGSETWYQPHSVVTHTRSSSTNDILREYLVQRARKTFRDTWSDRIRRCAPYGALEEGVWKGMGEPIRVLMIDDIVPDAALGSGYGRMNDVISALVRESDIHVSFFSANARTDTFPVPGVRLVHDLEPHLDSPGVDYDAVVISRPHNADRYHDLIAERLPRARLIYDAEALFYKRLESQARLAVDDGGAESLLQAAAEMERLERSLCSFADTIVCVSEDEAEVLRSVTSVPVRVVAPWVRDARPTVADFASRKDAGLIAGWSAGPNSPNCDGLLWFAREVLPKVVAAIPGFRLLVTGADPPSNISWLEGPSVHFRGRVRDLGVFYNDIRVAISPVRYGAGVKIKTVEAVQYGVPVVSTSEGAAGIPAEHRRSVWVADDPALFADALVSIMTDRAAWEELRARSLVDWGPELVEDAGIGAWPEIIRSAVS
jgi:GT2 family glycosyltransferase/glycosyltransferase involved in cell wall biosynthesis